MIKKSFFLFFLAFGLFFASVAQADFVGQRTKFSINSGYDEAGRTDLTAALIVMSNKAYFYVDEFFWNLLDQSQQQEARLLLENLAQEFDQKIYPTLTTAFGSEWRPGLDGDEKITILFHALREQASGYFTTADEYPKVQNPSSNEREMVYLSAKKLADPLIRSYLAHELTHLITFYQKDKLRGVTEDVWLNEARAEYAPTLLGYDLAYDHSNLQERVRQFVGNTFNSLVEWRGKPADYGVANLFVQYLADHYGPELIFQSLASSQTGIVSLEETLKKMGFKDDFAAIFTNWAVAVLVNDCGLGPRYCYLNANLNNFRVVPLTNILPLTGQSQLSSSQTTKIWAGNWYRFLGGKGKMTFEFSGQPDANFKLAYVLEGKEGKPKIGFLAPDAQKKAVLEILDFGSQTTSLTILPLVLGKKSDFLENEPFVRFSWQVSLQEQSDGGTTPVSEREKLLLKIAELTREIQRLQQELAKLKAGQPLECAAFSQDLYYGIMDSSEVKCLQEFLKNREGEIYPEQIVSGNYLSLTVLAVKRYQASKGVRQTGYFGPLTREAANLDISQ